MNRLWDIINKEGIEVIYLPLKSTPEELNGLYLCDEGHPIIALDENLPEQTRLFKCVLAEEVGHYMTAAKTNVLTAHIGYRQEIEMSRDERKALMWATDFLIPDGELIQMVNSGLRSCYELAEHFDVTHWFMLRKLTFMRMCFRRTGIKVKGRELYDMTLKNCFEC